MADRARMAWCNPVLLAALGIGACKMIDQTTFGAKPEKPAPSQAMLALKGDSTMPLVVVRFDAGLPAYATEVQSAVHMAETIRPDAKYEVVTVVPAKGDPAAQVKAIREATPNALAVQDALLGMEIDPDRIHLSARTDPNIPSAEIRIYVR